MKIRTTFFLRNKLVLDLKIKKEEEEEEEEKEEEEEEEDLERTT
jgi:5-methylcytosine-specific restriction endonuclease McrBC regulatory subunit McrC